MVNFDFKTYVNQSKMLNPKNKFKNIDSFYEKYKENTGFRNLEDLFNPDLINKMQDEAKRIRENYDVLLIIGVGGSYMGIKALIEALSPYYYNDANNFKVYFIGHNLNHEYLSATLNKISNKKVCVNVISKSGTTLEIFETLKIVKNELTITDEDIIYTSSNENFKTNTNYFYKIPNNIGGRFSVFTPAGLLPLAVMGYNLSELKDGAISGREDKNSQMLYALYRYKQIKNKKKIEVYVSYEKKLYYLLEWIKQLYGESLGKHDLCLFPASVINTTDLHSLGQLIQDGPGNYFETIIVSNKETGSLDYYNKVAATSVSAAHYMAKIDNAYIKMESINEYNLGFVMQFFMESVAYAATLEKVNPYDQPGVEAYKTIMKDNLKG